jgi:phosphate transport system permease protein
MSHASPSGAAEAVPADPPGPAARPQNPLGPVSLGRKKGFSSETGFRWFTTGSGVAVLVIIVAIATFLLAKALPAIAADKENFFTYKDWNPDGSDGARFGIAALAFGSIYVSALALLLAVPVSVGIALCLSHYAPRRVATPLGFVIDLLAAVPSVVFGFWGYDYFYSPVVHLAAWLHHYFGWIPILGEAPYGKSFLLGGIVLAIMLVPIITALSREVFLLTPRMNEEAALALGATKWEMIRMAVLPYGRPGVIGACMLGLGRALGETIALALLLSGNYLITFDLIHNGGNSVAANIANEFGNALDLGRGALIASGLVLFVITLVVNMAARFIIYRRREFLGSAA